MGSTVPWWASGVFTLAGATLTFLGTQWQSFRTERAQRRRLSRNDKVTAYLTVIEAAQRLTATPVWPADRQPDAESPDDQLHDLAGPAEHAAFYGPAPVNRAIDVLLTAATQHRDTIVGIRTDSKRGHDNGIDQRLRPKYQESLTALQDALDDFVRSCRKDLEIAGRYHPISNYRTQEKNPSNAGTMGDS